MFDRKVLFQKVMCYVPLFLLSYFFLPVQILYRSACNTVQYKYSLSCLVVNIFTLTKSCKYSLANQALLLIIMIKTDRGMSSVGFSAKCCFQFI